MFTYFSKKKRWLVLQHQIAIYWSYSQFFGPEISVTRKFKPEKLFFLSSYCIVCLFMDFGATGSDQYIHITNYPRWRLRAVC